MFSWYTRPFPGYQMSSTSNISKTRYLILELHINKTRSCLRSYMFLLVWKKSGDLFWWHHLENLDLVQFVTLKVIKVLKTMTSTAKPTQMSSMSRCCIQASLGLIHPLAQTCLFIPYTFKDFWEIIVALLRNKRQSKLCQSDIWIFCYPEFLIYLAEYLMSDLG